MIRPFLRWAGGKQNLVEEILEHVPPEDQIGRYFEPFLGAGSLFFANGFNNAFISDVNTPLINTYHQIRTDPRAIYHLIERYATLFSRDENFYYRLRDRFNTCINVRDHMQAARFIFLMHTNYNGMYRINRDGLYNVPIGKRSPCLPSFDHLQMVSNKLRNQNIRNVPYSRILNLVEESDFIYMDPPYPPLDENQQQQQLDRKSV